MTPYTEIFAWSLLVAFVGLDAALLARVSAPSPASTSTAVNVPSPPVPPPLACPAPPPERFRGPMAEWSEAQLKSIGITNREGAWSCAAAVDDAINSLTEAMRGG